MSQIRWLYTQPNGVLAVLASAHLEQLAREGFDTPEKVRALVLGKVAAQGGTDFIEMPDGWTPPTDRTFRNAWRMKGRSLEGVTHPECDKSDVDMPAAREIHRDKIRRKRIAALAALDVEYQRADEEGNQGKKREVAARKQSLRDAPADPAIDAARTPEELTRLLRIALAP